MSKEEAIANIKNQLKSISTKLFMFDKINQKFSEMKLKDGGILASDAETFELGVPVYKVVDGEQVAVEDGDYETEDGRIITVKEGKIDGMKDMTEEQPEENMEKPEDKTEEPMEETEAPEAPTTEEPKDDKIKMLEEQIGSITETLNQLIEIVNELSNKQEQAMSKIYEFSKSPSTEPIKETKTFKSTNTSEMKNEMNSLKDLIEFRKKTGNGNYNGFTIS